MNDFTARLRSRLPPSWATRAVWLILGVAGFWIAYRFGSNYMLCRANEGKANCVVIAFYATVYHVFEHVVATVIKLATLILP